MDFKRHARNKIRRLYQQGSVESYAAEFRRIAIGIPDISQAEKLERFIEGLKRNAKF